MNDTEHQYYFHLATSKALPPDISVVSSHDPDEIWYQGALTICQHLQEYLARSEGELDWQLEVSDDRGNVRYRYTFKAEKL